MRVFWAFVAVLVLLAGGSLSYSLVRQRLAAANFARAEADQARRAAEEARRVGDAAESEETLERLRADLDAAQRGADKPATAPSTTPPTEPAKAAPSPTPDSPAPATPADPALLGPDKIGDFSVSPGSVERRPDGTLLVDQKYVVRGEGTAASPYVITWEQLASVADAFNPRAGKRMIPRRVAMLHAKHVRVEGYIAFPLMSTEPRECLSMLNQWDGCCIGVPPTPYDAIEVTMTKPATGNSRYATAGAVTGLFEVKPYVMGDWLVGLYVMNQATLSATDFGGPAGN